MTMISVIVGSVRKHRFAEKPAQWIVEQLRKRDVETRCLDLADFPMPFFDEAMAPAGPVAPQQLHENLIELQVAPIRFSVHIPMSVMRPHFQGGDVAPGLRELEGSAKAMIEDLLWWTEARKSARAKESKGIRSTM